MSSLKILQFLLIRNGARSFSCEFVEKCVPSGQGSVSQNNEYLLQPLWKLTRIRSRQKGNNVEFHKFIKLRIKNIFVFKSVKFTSDITMTSQWAWWRLRSPASRLFTPPFIQTQIKENIKAPRHWPFCGEFTGTGEFPAQKASYAEYVSIWWRHHG